MADVDETRLPGIGTRYDFVSEESGDRLGVITRYGGGRELVVYDRADPDRCRVSVPLSGGDAQTMIDLLGGSQVSRHLDDLQAQMEGLVLEWLDVGEAAEVAGRSLGESQIHSRTGAYVVAVGRGDDAYPAPNAEFVLKEGDRLVALGTHEAVAALAPMLD